MGASGRRHSKLLFIAVTPLYVIGLLSSYFAARVITTGFYGQSTGTYDQYFNQYLPPVDVLYSFVDPRIQLR